MRPREANASRTALGPPRRVGERGDDENGIRREISPFCPGADPPRTSRRSDRGSVRVSVVFEADSVYHHIIVAEDGVARYLRFDRSLQSGMYSPIPSTAFPVRGVHAPGLLFRPQATRVLMVGLGGGSVQKRFWRDYPQMTIDVAEPTRRSSRWRIGTSRSARTRGCESRCKTAPLSAQNGSEVRPDPPGCVLCGVRPFPLDHERVHAPRPHPLGPGRDRCLQPHRCARGPAECTVPGDVQDVCDFVQWTVPVPTGFQPGRDLETLRNIILVASTNGASRAGRSSQSASGRPADHLPEFRLTRGTTTTARF